MRCAAACTAESGGADTIPDVVVPARPRTLPEGRQAAPSATVDRRRVAPSVVRRGVNRAGTPLPPFTGGGSTRKALGGGDSDRSRGATARWSWSCIAACATA